ncbi:MAG: hypothetical protein MJD61_02120 [Proteobacteria bacterium]|nr:hypothetical protein [Pseudomonadota bacterium]
MSADLTEKVESIKGQLRAADAALAQALDARAEAIKRAIELRDEHPDAYIGMPRDVDVLSELSERIEHFPVDAAKPVMREVLSACAAMVAPVEVAYMGVEGGLGHTAARKYFGSAARFRSAPSAEEVVAEVERKRASRGVLPWETSNDGTVTATLNALAHSDLKIGGEVTVKARYHMLSQSGDPAQIKTILGTPTAIAAAERFVLTRFADARIVDTRTGINAADQAAKDPEAAAICTEVVAQLTNLEFVQRSVQDSTSHEIRYVVAGGDAPARTGADRTAIVLATHDAPGELMACLKPLADRRVNLTRLETRAARGVPWRYFILMEMEGHITDRSVLTAVEEVRATNRNIQVLGSYPRPE